MSFRFSFRFHIPVLIGLLLSGSRLAADEQSRRGSADPEEIRLQTFDKVWETIRDVHWDPDLGGVDWDAVRTDLRPQAASAADDAELREVLQEMLDRLKQSHFGIIPAEVSDAELAGSGDGSGRSGLSIRELDGRMVVVHVEQDSAAAAAGIQPGSILLSIKGTDASDLLKKLSARAEAGTARRSTLVGLITERLTTGNVDGIIELTLMAPDGTEENKEIRLTQGDGTMARFGHLPPLYTQSVVRTISGKTPEESVGYFAFNCFFDPVNVMAGMEQAVEQHRDAAGLIIDVRGNRGGLAAMVMGMTRWFINEPTAIGTMIDRSGRREMKITPRAAPYGRKVAVLIDECSISSAEMLSAALQDLAGAKVFGSDSAGLVLPSLVIDLPNGDKFQYAFSDYERASGGQLEGPGVIPDMPVSLTVKALQNGNDPVLDAAVRWLRESE